MCCLQETETTVPPAVSSAHRLEAQGKKEDGEGQKQPTTGIYAVKNYALENV